MTKSEFKQRQIEIYTAEQRLLQLTHATLFQMLEAMTDIERQSLVGLELDTYKEIISIDSTGVNYEDTDVNETFFCELEELSQIQKKEIIDEIILNIWGL
jgi:hypothetical protein